MTAAACAVLIAAKAIVFVHACLVVIGMAARAIGSVARRRPVDRLGVGPVTFCTVEVAAVILRFECQCSVTIIRGSPRICNVAGIALLRRAEVSRVRAGSYDAVVAARTRSKHLCVIDSEHGRKHVGGVAVFADIRRLRVGRILAGCVCTVMAANTVSRDIDVIEIRR